MTEPQLNPNPSLWVSTTPEPVYPQVRGSGEVDVAIIGGGIAGLTAALLLSEAGAKVAVVEARRLLHGVTGYTTAKLTSQHGLLYDHLIKHFGEEKARLYGESQEAGIEQVAVLVERFGIQCDFARASAYTTVASESKVKDVEREVEAALKLGLPAEFVQQTELPFPIAAGVRFTEQARFHPRKYLLALSERIISNGGAIFAESRVNELSDDRPYRLKCDQGEITASQVVVTTHFPVFDHAFFFARLAQYRSYAIAARLKDGMLQGMYLGEEPFYSARPHQSSEGEWMIFGGGKHKAGQGGDTREHYAQLEEWARTHFQVESIDYRWSTQDNWSIDKVPYVGPMAKSHPELYVATGFGGWGMSNGTMAGMLLRDQILGRDNPWSELYDPARFKPDSIPTFTKENINVAAQLVSDRMAHPPVETPAPGHGEVVDGERGREALYREESGVLHRLSPVCTHMGCLVHWNPAEKSWDCPCHGGRFAADGRVIQGPPNKALDPLPAPKTEPEKAEVSE